MRDCFDVKNVIRFSKLRVTLKRILQRSTEIEIFWWSRFSVLDWMFNTTEEIADDFIAIISYMSIFFFNKNNLKFIADQIN